jgi:hypothetical protein
MKNCLIKVTLVLVCLALMSMSLLAQRGRGGNGGGGGSTGCAIVDTPRLSTSVTTTGTGAGVGVFVRVTNCSSGKKRYTITGSTVSSCGKETVFASALMSFSAHESKSLSIGFPVASDTCLGPMTVNISAYEGGTMLANGSTSLTVQ